MSQEALGMVETRGLVASIEVADTMLKAANVVLVRQRRSIRSCNCYGPRRCWSCKICSGVRCEKRKNLESLLATHVIPRPHTDVEKILPAIK